MLGPGERSGVRIRFRVRVQRDEPASGPEKGNWESGTGPSQDEQDEEITES